MHPGKESNFSKKSNVYLEFTSHIQTHMNNPRHEHHGPEQSCDRITLRAVRFIVRRLPGDILLLTIR